MTTLSELRQQELMCRDEAANEPVLEMKRALYRRALELGRIAEKMARDDSDELGSSIRRSGSK